MFKKWIVFSVILHLTISQNGTEDVEVTKFEIELPQLFLVGISQCAEANRTYCTKNDNYPLDYIEKLVHNVLGELSHLFDLVHLQPKVESTISGELALPAHKCSDEQAYVIHDDLMEEIQLCDSFEKVIYPTSGKSKSGTGLYNIFNTDNQKQAIRVNICSNTGKECDSYAAVPNGYITKCKQENNEFQLVSLTPQGGISIERFEFPAACSCVIVKDIL